MQDIADKADSTAGATGQLPASEYNNHKNELQGAVTASGQTLNASITDQLSQSVFINGVSAQSMTDSGSVNSIQLSPVTGASGLTVADSYTTLDGAMFSFTKSAANTSTTVIVNLGQTGTELGAKSLKRLDGSDPAIGDVVGECIVKYDGTNFVLMKTDTDAYITDASDTDVITAAFAKNTIVADATSGDMAYTLNAPSYNGQECQLEVDGSDVATVTINGGAVVIPSETGLSCVGVLVGGSLTWSYPTKGITRIDITANYPYTTSVSDDFQYIYADSLTANITITVADGGGDERNQFKVINDDNTYSVFVVDSVTSSITWEVEPGKKELFYMDGSLGHGSGEGLIYNTPGNTGAILESALNEPLINGGRYTVYMLDGGGNAYRDELRIEDKSKNNYSSASTGNTTYDGPSGTPSIYNSGYDFKKVWRWYQ